MQNQKSLFHGIIGNKLVLKRELCSRFNPKLFRLTVGTKKLALIVAWRDEFNAHMDFRQTFLMLKTLIPLILFSSRSQEKAIFDQRDNLNLTKNNHDHSHIRVSSDKFRP